MSHNHIGPSVFPRNSQRAFLDGKMGTLRYNDGLFFGLCVYNRILGLVRPLYAFATSYCDFFSGVVYKYSVWMELSSFEMTFTFFSGTIPSRS